jgi:hypothetical protein
LLIVWIVDCGLWIKHAGAIDSWDRRQSINPQSIIRKSAIHNGQAAIRNRQSAIGNQSFLVNTIGAAGSVRCASDDTSCSEQVESAERIRSRMRHSGSRTLHLAY